MKEFNPSPDFVKNTMARIQHIEEQRQRKWRKSAIRVAAQYTGAAGAMLIGIVNLVRLFAMVYAPVVCH
jgi:SRSO17 transposase